MSSAVAVHQTLPQTYSKPFILLISNASKVQKLSGYSFSEYRCCSGDHEWNSGGLDWTKNAEVAENSGRLVIISICGACGVAC